METIVLKIKRLGTKTPSAEAFKSALKKLLMEEGTYWARHTWATLASELDVPKETIAAALGHGRKTVTDIYIDFDMRKVDEANRLVIDYLNSDFDSAGEFLENRKAGNPKAPAM